MCDDDINDPSYEPPLQKRTKKKKKSVMINKDKLDGSLEVISIKVRVPHDFTGFNEIG